MDLCFLGHQVQEEYLMFAVPYQEPIVLVKLQFLDESEVDLAGTKL